MWPRDRPASTLRGPAAAGHPRPWALLDHLPREQPPQPLLLHHLQTTQNPSISPAQQLSTVVYSFSVCLEQNCMPGQKFCSLLQGLHRCMAHVTTGKSAAECSLEHRKTHPLQLRVQRHLRRQRQPPGGCAPLAWTRAAPWPARGPSLDPRQTHTRLAQRHRPQPLLLQHHIRHHLYNIYESVSGTVSSFVR